MKASDVLKEMIDDRALQLRAAGVDLLEGRGDYIGDDGFQRYLSDTKKWRTEISVLGDAFAVICRQEAQERFGVEHD